jgi:hypothetical protein
MPDTTVNSKPRTILRVPNVARVREMKGNANIVREPHDAVAELISSRMADQTHRELQGRVGEIKRQITEMLIYFLCCSFPFQLLKFSMRPKPFADETGLLLLELQICQAVNEPNNQIWVGGATEFKVFAQCTTFRSREPKGPNGLTRIMNPLPKNRRRLRCMSHVHS